MIARCASVALALALAGCGVFTDDEPSFEGAEIECIGMTYGIPLAGYSRVATRYGARCNWLISDTLYDDSPAIATEANLGAENTVALTFTTRGTTWVAREGRVRVIENDGDRMSGTYDVLAEDPQGNRLNIRGPFDFCAYGARTDCPHQSAGGLETRVGFDDSAGAVAAFESSYTTECRVLIDRASGGLQVDLQLGVFNGINIAHWVDGCEVPRAPLDRFTFRSGGVDGPGAYGPFTTRSLPDPRGGADVVLPQLDVQLPLHYLGRRTACLTDMGRYIGVVAAPDVTACSFAIEEASGDRPGRFELSCANAARLVIPAMGVAEYRDFELQAECAVRYTD